MRPQKFRFENFRRPSSNCESYDAWKLITVQGIEMICRGPIPFAVITSYVGIWPDELPQNIGIIHDVECAFTEHSQVYHDRNLSARIACQIITPVITFCIWYEKYHRRLVWIKCHASFIRTDPTIAMWYEIMFDKHLHNEPRIIVSWHSLCQDWVIRSRFKLNTSMKHAW